MEKRPTTSTWFERKIGRPRINLRVPAKIIRKLKLQKRSKSFEWQYTPSGVIILFPVKGGK